jgi:hypothetical protein
MQFINPDNINRVLFLYYICIESIYMHCSGVHSYKTGKPNAPPEMRMILLLTQVSTNM